MGKQKLEVKKKRPVRQKDIQEMSTALNVEERF